MIRFEIVFRFIHLFIHTHIHAKVSALITILRKRNKSSILYSPLKVEKYLSNSCSESWMEDTLFFDILWIIWQMSFNERRYSTMNVRIRYFYETRKFDLEHLCPKTRELIHFSSKIDSDRSYFIWRKTPYAFPAKVSIVLNWNGNIFKQWLCSEYFLIGTFDNFILVKLHKDAKFTNQKFESIFLTLLVLVKMNAVQLDCNSFGTYTFRC